MHDATTPPARAPVTMIETDTGAAGPIEQRAGISGIEASGPVTQRAIQASPAGHLRA